MNIEIHLDTTIQTNWMREKLHFKFKSWSNWFPENWFQLQVIIFMYFIDDFTCGDANTKGSFIKHPSLSNTIFLVCLNINLFGPFNGE